MGLFRRKRPKFGEILVERGLATQNDIDEALKIQKELREANQIQKNLGTILTEKGDIGMEDIDAVLEEQKRREGFIRNGLIYSIFHSGQPK